MGAPQAELTPLAFLQLAGHPLRWRLLSDLARSDRTVHELTGLVGQPQNLVSYHLGKLRDARLVSARRGPAPVVWSRPTALAVTPSPCTPTPCG